MSCNAWNHRIDCDCDFRGGHPNSGGWFGPHATTARADRPLSNGEHGYTRTSCPICGDAVYFVRPFKGGAVWFDEMGVPWPKHGCFADEADTSDVRIASSFVRLASIAKERVRATSSTRVVRPPKSGEVFKGLDLRWVNLTGMDLKGVIFIACDFREALLGWADFSGGALLGCDLRDAQLRGTNFRSADLKRSRFHGAHTEDADFAYANPCGTRGLKGDIPKSAERGPLPPKPPAPTDARVWVVDMAGVVTPLNNQGK